MTKYFKERRQNPDRQTIKDEWIVETIEAYDFKEFQKDGRTRYWKRIKDFENRFLRVIVLEDGETIHNAFWDRRFRGVKDED